MVNEDKIQGSGLPLGFSMALAQNSAAMERFAALSEQERDSILSQARSARSRTEMQALITSIAPGGTFF